MDKPLVTIKPEVKIAHLEELKRKALNNAAAQRRKEEARLYVRVPSSYWFQAARDYENEIDDLKKCKPGNKKLKACSAPKFDLKKYKNILSKDDYSGVKYFLKRGHDVTINIKPRGGYSIDIEINSK